MTNHIYTRAVDIDIDSDTIDIVAHNGSTTGLALNGTVVTASAARINAACVVDGSSRFVTMGNSMAPTEILNLDQSVHANKTILVDTATTYNGQGVTSAVINFPAATGTGNIIKVYLKRTLLLGTAPLTFTANSIVSTGRFYGTLTCFQDAGSTALHDESVAGGASSFVIGLDAGGLTGGVKGDMLTFIDVGTDQWFVRGILSGQFTETLAF